MKQEESRIAEKISQYLQSQYPKVVYRFDVADMKLTMPQAIRMKKLQGINNRGYSDLFIAEPNKTACGLFIELKKNRSEVFLKDGITFKKKSVKKNGVFLYDHIQEQVKFIDKMNEKGYKAVFGFGFDETKIIIDEYLKGIK